MKQIEINIGELAKAKKKVWVKPTSSRKGHYREIETGKKGELDSSQLPKAEFEKKFREVRSSDLKLFNVYRKEIRSNYDIENDEVISTGQKIEEIEKQIPKCNKFIEKQNIINNKFIELSKRMPPDLSRMIGDIGEDDVRTAVADAKKNVYEEHQTSSKNLLAKLKNQYETEEVDVIMEYRDAEEKKELAAYEEERVKYDLERESYVKPKTSSFRRHGPAYRNR